MHTVAERPDLWERGIDSGDVWPEYNLHGDVLNRWWHRLPVDFPEHQFVLLDEETDEVVAEGHTAPIRWDGLDATLPEGIDATIEQAFALRAEGGRVDTLCALSAEVPRTGRTRGLALPILQAMRTVAERQGLTRFVAPVRPSLKERYPITPIEQYVAWRRTDGELFDPWMRLHERLGARTSTPLPRPLRITGTVAEWEGWTGMALPATGDYVFPEGLATLHVDRDADLGSYWEPNVWMVHPEVR